MPLIPYALRWVRRRAADRASAARRAKLLGTIDLRSARGLEIGVLSRPLVRKSEGSVLYVDYAPTQELRDRPFDFDAADAVDVDAVWNENPLAECIADKRSFDYVLADRVVERAPDLIGWFLDVRAVLREGGVLGLACADRRFSSDFRRHDSTIGEMVEAYLLRLRQPSIRQVFDHRWYGVKLDHRLAWRTDPNLHPLPKLAGESALHLAYEQALEISRSPRYIESTCWVFTPASFIDSAAALTELDLFPYLVESIEPTPHRQMEFFVRLRAAGREDREKIRESLVQASHFVANAASERHYRKRVAAKRR